MLMRAVLMLFFLLYTSASIAQSFSPAGTWVVRLGPRVLMVLTLAPSSQKGLAFAGSLAEPKNWNTGDGLTFTGVESETVSKRVIASERRGDSLFFTIENVTNPAYKDSWLLHPIDARHAELHPAEAPTLTIPMMRADKPALVSIDWNADKSYSVNDGLPSNAEMKRIIDADQAARAPGAKTDWSKVGPADADRRSATMKLLDEGVLRTGDDFARAAFVFQHGDKPDDYLLAHTLAMIAVAKGNNGALWIGTATLDRYLQSIGQKQVYGTQFKTKEGVPATQEPYNRTLISDALRKQLGVPVLTAQEEQRESYDKERSSSKNP